MGLTVGYVLEALEDLKILDSLQTEKNMLHRERVAEGTHRARVALSELSILIKEQELLIELFKKK